MANKQGQNRDLENDRTRQGQSGPTEDPNRNRDQHPGGQSRQGQGDVEDQNIGDGTDSGGSGYREQQFPGQGHGEIQAGEARRGNRGQAQAGQDKGGQGSRNR